MGTETPTEFRVGLNNQYFSEFSDDTALVHAAFTDLLQRSSKMWGLSYNVQ